MMKKALELARKSAHEGEVPVGCLVTGPDGRIIGRGRNRRETAKNALAHAEIEAIGEACRSRGDWRLDGCSLYVTLEPCAMCAGAVINSRISRVFYGAKEPLSGACGSVLNLFMEFQNSAAVVGGVLERECADVLEEFFKRVREK
ncbi:MAG: nucleoside deaminase [Clostridiales bacterium]|jgi:tRNA(adenine34) deaminase|nr:nucleoside deaminase [Clostridiales bacterium]